MLSGFINYAHLMLELDRIFKSTELKSQPEVFFSFYKPFRDFDNVTSATKEMVVVEFNSIFKTNYKAIDIVKWHSVRDWAM